MQPVVYIKKHMTWHFWACCKKKYAQGILACVLERGFRHVVPKNGFTWPYIFLTINATYIYKSK
jgi:hypothetical protein